VHKHCAEEEKGIIKGHLRPPSSASSPAQAKGLVRFLSLSPQIQIHLFGICVEFSPVV